MRAVRAAAAVLLALPLIVFGGNYFVGAFPLPPGDGSAGDKLLQAMRSGGLMSPLAFSHVVTGVLMLVPRTRFIGALLQLPISLGMVAFHVTMLPSGLVLAGPMLMLNLIALEPSRLRLLTARDSADHEDSRL
jgi:putative oxidoreductase